MDVLQLILLRHWHAAHSLGSVLLVEESAVADHHRRDALVGTVEQGLQAAARHACGADVLRVDLLIVGRGGVGVLAECPVDALNLLSRGRHRAVGGLLFHGDVARGEDEVAVRGNLVEELEVFPGRVGAGAVAPYEDGQRVLGIELREILRGEDGVGGQRGLFLHHGLERAGAAVLDHLLLGSLTQEELGHLLERALVERHGAMLAAGYVDKVLQSACFLQGLGEADALALRHHVVGIAVDDEEAGILLRGERRELSTDLVDVGDGTDECHQLGIVGGCTAHECGLGALVVLHGLAVLHVGHVDGAEPVDYGVDAARVVEVASHGALKVDGGLAHRALLQAVGHAGERREVAAAAEAGDADERRVELILGGMGADEAQGALHVMDLCRKLGVAARTVVDAHHGEARIVEGLAQRHVGHLLGVVRKPRAAVDEDHHFILGLFGLWQVDVHAVCFEVVAGIVDVLVRCFVFGHGKSALRLRHGQERHAQHEC